jgi:hypothetical protein
VEHTGGPWALEWSGAGYNRQAEVIADIPGKKLDKWSIGRIHNMGEETEPNARLIAAAPELLAALAGLFEHCAMIHKHWGDGDNQQQADAAIDAALAAIAKAEGR